MQWVEQHIIARTDRRYRAIDAMAFASKNLWNLANYQVRQAFIFEQQYLTNAATFHLLKATEAYRALPSKVANQVLLQLHHAWTAFFAAKEVYREDPARFMGRPRLPRHLHKTQGRASPGL